MQNTDHPRPSCLAEADAKPGVEEDTHSQQNKMPKATPDRAVLIHAGLLSAGLSLDFVGAGVGGDVGVDVGARWQCMQNTDRPRPSCLAEADAKPGMEEDTPNHQNKMPKATPDRAVLICAGLRLAGLSVDFLLGPV